MNKQGGQTPHGRDFHSYDLLAQRMHLRQEHNIGSQGEERKLTNRQAAGSKPPQVSSGQRPAARDIKPLQSNVEAGVEAEAANSPCTLTPFGRVLCRPERVVPFNSVPTTPMEVLADICPGETLIAV